MKRGGDASSSADAALNVGSAAAGVDGGSSAAATAASSSSVSMAVDTIFVLFVSVFFCAQRKMHFNERGVESFSTHLCLQHATHAAALKTSFGERINRQPQHPTHITKQPSHCYTARALAHPQNQHTKHSSKNETRDAAGALLAGSIAPRPA